MMENFISRTCYTELTKHGNYDAKGMLLHAETWPFRVQKYAYRKNENGNNKEC